MGCTQERTDQCLRRVLVSAIKSHAFFQQGSKLAALLSIGLATDDKVETKTDAIHRGFAAGAEHPLGELARRFELNAVIHQGERLQRRVCFQPTRDTHLTVRGGKCRQGWMRHRSLPKGVETAPV